MRGKVSVLCSIRPEVRITPAYAGKSYEEAAKQVVTQDHPRVCGEKCEWFRDGVNAIGSPPRMRGKAPGELKTLVDPGITPAYAGKSRRLPPMQA